MTPPTGLEPALAEILDTGPRIEAFCAAHGLDLELGDLDHEPTSAALRERLLARLPAEELRARLRASFPRELALRSRYRLAGIAAERPEATRLRLMLPQRQPLVGRQALLLALRGALLRDRRALVHGPAGLGKSAASREAAEILGADLSLVAWLRADEETRLRADLLTLWAHLVEQELIAEGDDLGVEARLESVRSRLAREPRWLIVLDGASADRELAAAILCASAGRVIVSARTPPHWASGAAQIEVPPLDPDEAMALLVRASGRHRLGRGEAEAAAELAERLGRKPGALLAAGREVASRGLSWIAARDEHELRGRPTPDPMHAPASR